MDDEAYAKRDARVNKTRKESVATPDIFADNYGVDSKVYIEQIKKQIDELQNALCAKDKQIEIMKQQICDMVVSKSNLVMNSNQALD